MSLQVIGAGLGRTGTASLKTALETLLGGRCYHMFEVFEHLDDDLPALTRAAHGETIDWPEFFDGWDASVDWPTCAWWDQIADAFPDSLILLSTRDSFETWYRSATNTIFGGFAGEDRDDEWFLMMKAALTDHFCWPLTDEDALREAYRRHNDRVRAEAPAHRLLEWQPGDGWEPICERLGVAVPDEPFPHRNTTEEFRRSRQKDSDS